MPVQASEGPTGPRQGEGDTSASSNAISGHIHVGRAGSLGAMERGAVRLQSADKKVDNRTWDALHNPLRPECMVLHVCRSLAEANAELDGGRRDYTNARPQGGLGGGSTRRSTGGLPAGILGARLCAARTHHPGPRSGTRAGRGAQHYWWTRYRPQIVRVRRHRACGHLYQPART